MASAGRGGRGAAILEALKQGTRRPGEGTKTVEQPSGDAASPALPTPSVSAPVAPVGRGAMMMSMLKKQQEESSQPQQPGTAAAPKPMGRGLASFKALLERSSVAQPAGIARGAAVPGSVVPTQSVPVSPAATPPLQPTVTVPAGPGPQGDSSEPPTNRLARMALDRTPTVHNSGQDGKSISLSANYIHVKCKNAGVYQYHVSFHPEIDSKGMRYKLVNEHRDVIGNTRAFDGSILFLPIKLEQQETVLTSVRPTDNVPITITIRLVKVLPPSSCHQLYNIVFRRIMSVLEMVQVGRYYYNPNTPTSIPVHKLEVWPGYITSISEQEGGLMLLADASHRVLRTETVLDVMQSIVDRNASGFRDEVIRTLVGTVVLTRYNNKTYRVDDIVWDKTPRHTFSTSNGGECSFIDYYQKAYNITIRDKEQPLLLHRPKKQVTRPGERERKQLDVVCLIPELCYMTGLSDALRKDFNVMKDLAVHTRVTPEQRKLTMKKFVDAVNSNPDAKSELERWGLELDTDTVNFDGRLLPQEDIVFGSRKIAAGPEADWNRHVTREQVITAVPLNSWVVLYTRRDEANANEFIKTMLKVCPQMGIQCKPPQHLMLTSDRVESYIKGLRDTINNRVQMIVAICPTSRDDRYSAIKKTCCVDHPIPSQVINGRTISNARKLNSVTQKIALQINCKLGGELWGVANPFKTMMIVGIDIYHDTTGRKQSICGFVASVNRNCTRWFSRCRIQPVSQELVDGLKICLISALTKYHEVNHALPDKILVFRDGVGDGQLNTVSDYEVPQLKSCFTHFGEEYKPMLSVVIVQKRINTKIFYREQGRRQLQNPPSGTLVDHTITRRDKYDFFLVSQHVRQGTVSPTHYIVVNDDAAMKPDHMQRMAYKMTHMYYNWPGTVRVPAPCQYAHKLAYLVGQSIHKEPSAELSDRLFFL